MFFRKRKEEERKKLKQLQNLKAQIAQEQYFVDMMKGINVDLICDPKKLIDISNAYYIESFWLNEKDRIVTISEQDCKVINIHNHTVIGKEIKIKGLLTSHINQSYCSIDSIYKFSNYQSVKIDKSRYKFVPLIEKDSFFSRYIDGILPFEEVMNFYYHEKHKVPRSIKVQENDIEQLKAKYQQLLHEKEKIKETEEHFQIDNLYLIKFKKDYVYEIPESNHFYLVAEKIRNTGNISSNTRKFEKECQYINFFTGVPVISFYFYNQFEYYDKKHRLNELYIEMIPLSEIVNEKTFPYSTLIELYSKYNNIEKPVFKIKYKVKK